MSPPSNPACSIKSQERVPSSSETVLEGIPMGELKKLEIDEGGRASKARPLRQVDEATLNRLERARSVTAGVKENVPSRSSRHQHSKRSSRKLHQPPAVAPTNHRRVSSRQLTSRPYHRPLGREEVSKHLPSCSTLPEFWTPIHDRLIAYLATHAPLTVDGKIPAKEECKERWTSREMIDLLKERFSRLIGAKLRSDDIEDRLRWLDIHAQFDYFRMPYGAYQMEDWGHGI